MNGCQFQTCLFYDLLFFFPTFPSGTYIDTWRGRVQFLTGYGRVGSNLGFDREGGKQEGLFEFPLYLRPPEEKKESQSNTEAEAVTTSSLQLPGERQESQGWGLTCMR